jgi:hypothetical protein
MNGGRWGKDAPPTTNEQHPLKAVVIFAGCYAKISI